MASTHSLLKGELIFSLINVSIRAGEYRRTKKTAIVSLRSLPFLGEWSEGGCNKSCEVSVGSSSHG